MFPSLSSIQSNRHGSARDYRDLIDKINQEIFLEISQENEDYSRIIFILFGRLWVCCDGSSKGASFASVIEASIVNFKKRLGNIQHLSIS